VARIGPGPLTRSAARELTEFQRRVRENADALARLPKRPERWVPVTVTDYDAASDTYSGREDAFASDGTRYAKPGGRSFGPGQFAKIHGIGDENDALQTIPAEAWVRHAVTTSSGDYWELDAACKCIRGDASGSNLYNLCCPEGIPSALTCEWFLTRKGSGGATDELQWVVNGTPVTDTVPYGGYDRYVYRFPATVTSSTAFGYTTLTIRAPFPDTGDTLDMRIDTAPFDVVATDISGVLQWQCVLGVPGSFSSSFSHTPGTSTLVLAPIVVATDCSFVYSNAYGLGDAYCFVRTGGEGGGSNYQFPSFARCVA
jgi:hypothetical protein